jgi:hypothetical protein
MLGIQFVSMIVRFYIRYINTYRVLPVQQEILSGWREMLMETMALSRYWKGGERQKCIPGVHKPKKPRRSGSGGYEEHQECIFTPQRQEG